MKWEMTAQAERQLQEVTDWTSVNSSASAAHALLAEIASTMARVERHPLFGHTAPNVRRRGVRRVHLPVAPYHLYYRVDEARDALVLLAVHHTRRGGPPAV